MDNKKSMLLAVLGVAFTLGAGIVGVLQLDDKIKMMDRKIDAAVDKRFITLIPPASDEKQQQ